MKAMLFTTAMLPACDTLRAMLCAGEERQQMAGRCLGELVRKMGERVLTHIIPILQKGMSSEDAATRQASPSRESARPLAKGTGSWIWASPQCALL